MKDTPDKKLLKEYECSLITWNKGRHGKYKILKKINYMRKKLYEHLIYTNVFGIRDKIKQFKKQRKRKNEKI